MKADDTIHQIVEHNAIKNRMTIVTMVMFIFTVISAIALYMTESVIALIAAILFLILTFTAAFNITESSKKESLTVLKTTTPPSFKAIRDGLDAEHGERLYGIDGNELDHDTCRCFTMSLDVNRLYTTLPLMVEIPEERYRFPDSVLSYTPYLKTSRDKELSRFVALRPDKVVMGLGSDINISTFDDLSKPIEMYTVSRSAVQVTDDAFSKIIINKLKVHDKVVFDGHSLCLDENGHLIPFSKSGSANEVDIHSLIISNDGYLMFRKGNETHPLFPNKIISSAACSLLPEEIDITSPIQESMIQSIHNKIHVLYDFPDTVDMRSSFVGFARIIERGGAPEFYCITRVDLDKDSLIASHNDDTAVFVEDALTEMVPRLDSVDNAALYIARAVTALRESLPRDISLSTSALLLAVEDAFYDMRIAGKALRRIGLIDDEFADNPYRSDNDSKSSTDRKVKDFVNGCMKQNPSDDDTNDADDNSAFPIEKEDDSDNREDSASGDDNTVVDDESNYEESNEYLRKKDE